MTFYRVVLVTVIFSVRYQHWRSLISGSRICLLIWRSIHMGYIWRESCIKVCWGRLLWMTMCLLRIKGCRCLRNLLGENKSGLWSWKSVGPNCMGHMVPLLVGCLIKSYMHFLVRRHSIDQYIKITKKSNNLYGMKFLMLTPQVRYYAVVLKINHQCKNQV